MINLLPQNIRLALATVSGLDTHHKVAEEAYKIINMTKDRSTINEVRTCTSCMCQAAPRMEPGEVDAVYHKGQRGQGKPGKPAPDGSRKGSSKNFVCFAHKKFGTKAFSCKTGCSFAHLPLAQREAGNGPVGR